MPAVPGAVYVFFFPHFVSSGDIFLLSDHVNAVNVTIYRNKGL